MGTPLLSWETAKGNCTRYDLDATGSQEDKTDQGCSGGRGKKAISYVLWEVMFLLKELSFYRYYRMVVSHTVLTVENVNAPNSGYGAFAYISTEPASGLVHPFAGVARYVLPMAKVTALRIWWEVEILTHSSGSSLFLI